MSHHLADFYIQELRVKRAQFTSGPQRPQPPSTWERLKASFGSGMPLGATIGLGTGAGMLLSAGMRGDESAKNPLIAAGLLGAGALTGSLMSGTSQVVEDEYKRQVNIAARRKIIEAERMQQLAGGTSAPAMQAAVAPAAPVGGDMSPSAVLMNALRPAA